MKEEKQKFALWIRCSILDTVDRLYKYDNCRSKSEYIEKAIEFYSGYLTTRGSNDYLPKVLLSTLRGTLDLHEDRMASLLFKLAVEISMMLHVTAATNEIDEDTLSRLRGRCVQEVKTLHGKISFDKAVHFQKSE